MVETVDTLCKEGATTLTIEALKQHALQPDQRLRLEMEARTGEHKVERAKAQSEQELQRLLGHPTALPGIALKNLQANGASSLSESADTSRNTHSQKRIEREAFRDPVGDQIRAGNALTCTFSGVLSIAPQRFLDSGISRVECPDCKASRSLSLRHEVLRFPPHDKRKTRTPQTDRRWAKRETAWEVIGG
jgi:hypothetical protein